MLVSINQPAYLPWAGYFHRIAVSDLHVVLDHVQFEKNSFTNRNKIRTPAGWMWLTVPVKTRGRFGDLSISSLEIDDSNQWRRKHWNALSMSYSKAPWFKPHAPYFESAYRREWCCLNDLLRDMLHYMLDALGITTRLLFSSEMELGKKGGELVLEICRAAGADRYLSGPLGRDYLDPAAFERAGIGLAYDDYVSPVYKQAYPGFEPNLAGVDLLFNEGPDSLKILLTDDGLVTG